jgi:hypothetical protein
VGKEKGGFMEMILSVLGLVLFCTLFSNILAAFYTLYGTTNASAYIAFQTVVSIAPTVLFLGGIFGAGLTFLHGYKHTAGSNGLLTMVIGALTIILFITLFGTIMTAMEAVRTYANIATFIALGTVVTIAPTVLLLGGIFGGGMAVVGGWKQRKSSAKGGALGGI